MYCYKYFIGEVHNYSDTTVIRMLFHCNKLNVKYLKLKSNILLFCDLNGEMVEILKKILFAFTDFMHFHIWINL